VGGRIRAALFLVARFERAPVDGQDGPDRNVAGRARLGAVREGAPLTVLDRHFKS